MKRLIIIILGLMLLFPFSGGAQFISNLPKDSIQVEDGLPSNEVYHLYQDNKGYIWMATDNGVVRYSGDEIKTYTKSDGLPENVVFRFYHQKDGRIVGECNNNKYFIIDTKGEITPHPLNKALGKHLDNYLFCYGYYEDSLGNYHIGTRKAYYKFDSNYQLLESEFDKGNSYRTLVYKEFDDYVLTYTLHGGNPKEGTIIQTGSNLLYQSNIGTITVRSWYATKWDSTIALNFGNKTFIVQEELIDTLETPTDHLGVFEIDDYLWVTTRGDGAYCYSIKDNYKLIDHVMPGLTTTAVIKGKDDVIYIGSTSSGVHTYQLNVPIIEFSSELNHNIRTFFKDQQELIVAYENGMVWFQEELHFFGPNWGISEIVSWNERYFANFGEMYELPFKKIVKLDFPYSGPAKFTESNIWLNDSISISNSLLNLYWLNHKNKTITQYHSLSSGDKITDMLISKDQLLVSRINEIVVIDPIKDCLITQYSFDENIIELGENQNMRLAVSDLGTLFYLSEKEVVRRKLPIQQYGLKVQSAYYENNELYTCTNKGVYCWDMKTSNIELKRFYPMTDAIKIKKFNGELYLQCRKSIRRIDTTMQGIGLPIARLKKVLVNQREVTVAEVGRLAYDNNNLTFNIARIGKGLEIGKYRYQLKGHDPEYQYSTEGKITYNNLPPGEYTFVYASSKDGVRYTPNQEIWVNIAPPFWKTIWFMVLTIALGVFIVFGLFWLRLKSVRRKSEWKQAIAMLKSKALAAQLNPHLMFNVLNSIQGLVSEKDEERANRYISRFSRFLRMSLNYSKKNLVTLKEEIEITKAYITLEKIRFGNEVEFEVQEIENMENYLVPPLIIQPLIENAIKHGVMPSANEDKKIGIDLNVDGGVLSISVSDNGEGFQSDSLGDGLRITQQRVQSFHPNNDLVIEKIQAPTIVKLTLNQ